MAAKAPHSPNVWVFMNQEPEIGNLIKDRWRFWTIPDKEGKLAKARNLLKRTKRFIYS